MSRINVYLPDDLAARAKAADLNVSKVTQTALRNALSSIETDTWLEGVGALRPIAIPRDAIISALASAKDELGNHD